MVDGRKRGVKMSLKRRVVDATHLNAKDKEKYYQKLDKYDVPTLRKILNFKRLIK